MIGDTAPTERHWERLLEQARATRRRTSVISSEFFADAPDDETIARLMPSQWQQYVQNGLRMGYEDWLEHMLRKPPYDKPTAAARSGRGESLAHPRRDRNAAES